ncbi:hypothetical protein EGJ86_23540 [Pseudomonas sp. o96-267]|uniref:ADP-ribosyltransferase-containing protein n=1 Tax=Pseudomonas sp. o96-267 TaxID=2479853 RepID=UPI000F79BE22|nr:LPD23 domain-containing protein [Pseudomonas sp. o96-267]RRV28908.1 hypothetical protein EGJ86_23540 [Pseudomonas sp. o96-267]
MNTIATILLRATFSERPQARTGEDVFWNPVIGQYAILARATVDEAEALRLSGWKAIPNPDKAPSLQFDALSALRRVWPDLYRAQPDLFAHRLSVSVCQELISAQPQEHQGQMGRWLMARCQEIGKADLASAIGQYMAFVDIRSSHPWATGNGNTNQFLTGNGRDSAFILTGHEATGYTLNIFLTGDAAPRQRNAQSIEELIIPSPDWTDVDWDVYDTLLTAQPTNEADFWSHPALIRFMGGTRNAEAVEGVQQWQDRVRTEGLAAVLGERYQRLQKRFLNSIPAAWLDQSAKEHGLRLNTQRAYRQLADCWMTLRASDDDCRSEIIPALREAHPKAFAQHSDDQLLVMWRELYQPTADHLRADSSASSVQPRTSTAFSAMQPDAMREVLAAHYGAPAIDALISTGRLHLIADHSGLPQEVQLRSSSNLSSIAGATTPDNRVYLVGSRIAPQTLPGLFLHEVGEHAGLAAMLGPDYGRLSKQFQKLLRDKDTYATWAAMRVPASTPAEHVPSEQLAYLVERVANDQVARPGGEAGFALGQECLSNLRTWLFRTPLCRWLDDIGALDDFTLRPQDMASLARESVDFFVAQTTHGTVTTNRNGWVEKLQPGVLDDLFKAGEQARIDALEGMSSEQALGYLYALAMTKAPMVEATIDHFAATLADLSSGEQPELQAIASELLALQGREEVQSQLAAQYERAGFAMWVDGSSEPKTAELHFLTPSPKREGAFQLNHYKRGIGAYSDDQYNTVLDALSTASRSSFMVADTEAPAVLQQWSATTIDNLDEQTRSKSFNRWFGQSQAVDEAGSPKVMYHGTGHVFTHFKEGKPIWASFSPELASDYAMYRGEWEQGSANIMPVYMRAETPFDADQLGSTVSLKDFFSEAMKQADAAGRSIDIREAVRLITHITSCAQREESGPLYRTYEVWNEAQMKFGKDGAESLKAYLALTGFDSIKVTEQGQLSFGVFNAGQVKSAIGNRGTFDLGSGDIRHRGDNLESPAFREWFDKSRLVDVFGQPQVLYRGLGQPYDVDAGNADSIIWVTPDADYASEYATANASLLLDGKVIYETGANVIPVYAAVRNPYDLGFTSTRDAVTYGEMLDSIEVGIQRAFDLETISQHTAAALMREIDEIRGEAGGEKKRVHQWWTERSGQIKSLLGRAGYDAIKSREGFADRTPAYGVFHPSQIKSAIANVGTFDPANPDIRFKDSASNFDPVAALKRWAGDTKVVEANGLPKVVFHGTGADISQFAPAMIGTSADAQNGTTDAFWFSSSVAVSETFANLRENPTVMPVFLRMENPLIVDCKEWARRFGTLDEGFAFTPNDVAYNIRWFKKEAIAEARAKGHDGVIFEGGYDATPVANAVTYAAFEATQIKSAIGNVGTFDPNNPNIQFSQLAPGTDSPAFRDWFGKSMVVDDDGKPKRMYHGSYRDFSSFDRMASTQTRRVSMDTVGSWFSDNPGEGGAGMYGNAIYPVYLSISRPKVYDEFSQFLADMHEANGERLEDKNPPGIGSPEALRERLKAQGYDGIAFCKTENKALYTRVETLRAERLQAMAEYRSAAELIAEQGGHMTRVQGKPYQDKIDAITDQIEEAGKALADNPSTEFDDQYVWIAFEPEQIKSAIGNVGTFDRENPDIRFSSSQTTTAAFKNWFGDGQVVDANGDPLVVYHGTNADFTTFDKAKRGSNTGWNNARQGFFFIADRKLAEDFARENGGGSRIVEAYVSIKKPLRLTTQDIFNIAEQAPTLVEILTGERIDDAQEALAQLDEILDLGNMQEAMDELSTDKAVAIMRRDGYDGIFSHFGDGNLEYVAFEPEQIKSATDNAGTFDRQNRDIRFSFAGERAKGANLEALANAKRISELGSSPATVLEFTGWFKGIDGRWRYEISDDKAAFKSAPEIDLDAAAREMLDDVIVSDAGGGLFRAVYRNLTVDHCAGYGRDRDDALRNMARHFITRRDGGVNFDIRKIQDGDTEVLSDVLDHPELFDAYPHLSSLVVQFVNYESITERGKFYEYANRIELNCNLQPAQLLSTLLHEIQHSIQAREDFARGGNSDQDFAGNVKRLLTQMSEDHAREVELWKVRFPHLIENATMASALVTSALKYDSFSRLIDYCQREKPSSMFRHIRNEVQWLFSPEIYRDEKAHAEVLDIQRRFYDIPKRGPKRNLAIRDIAFDAAQIIRNSIPGSHLAQFRADTRTTKGMINALRRASAQARQRLQPLREREASAAASAHLVAESRFKSAFDIYRSLAGEVEARATQARQHLTPQERRSRPVQRDMDVPAAEAIVILGGCELTPPFLGDSTALFDKTQTPAFKTWFGGSRIVDTEGKPLVLYHGSRTKGEAIDSFDLLRTGSSTDSGWLGTGFYFGDRAAADAYAGHHEFDPDHFPQGGVVYPVYLSIKNPAMLLDTERNDGPRTMVRELLDLPDEATADEVREGLIAAGYDGVVYERYSYNGAGYKEYMALHPEQIKSAIGNVGTFAIDNAGIRYSFAGPEAETANHTLLSKAEQRLAAGDDAEAVRRDTGWFRGHDGAWRFEISDDKVTLQDYQYEAGEIDGHPVTRMDGSLGDHAVELNPVAAAQLGYSTGIVTGLMNHPELFAAYPELAKLNVTIEQSEGYSFSENGVFRRGGASGDTIHIRCNPARGGNPVRSLLHEVQHAVQKIEGFARGGSVSEFNADQLISEELAGISQRVTDTLNAYPETAKVYRALVRAKIQAADADWPEPEAAAIAALESELIELPGGEALFDLETERFGIQFIDKMTLPFERYRHLAGEVEARNVESRMDFDSQMRLDIPPQQTEDVDPARIEVRMNQRYTGPGPVLAAALEQSTQETVEAEKAGVLDMSDAARLARARAMGFNTDQKWYHGSNSAGFKAFNTDGKGKTAGTGAFMAAKREMASSFTEGNGDALIFRGQELFDDPTLLDGIEIERYWLTVEANGSIHFPADYSLYASEAAYLDEEGIELDEGDSVRAGYTVYWRGRRLCEYADEAEVVEQLDEIEEREAGIYELFVRTSDQLVVEWEGNNWDHGPEQTVWVIASEAEGDIDHFDDRESAERALATAPVGSVIEERVSFQTTDEAAREAREMGYDSIMIKNVCDTGSFYSGEIFGDIIIVFDPANIRATHAAFDPAHSASNNLLFSLAEAPQSAAFDEWFEGSQAINEDGTPLVVFRGEHGQPSDAVFQSRLGSISFGDYETASLYATEPNNRADTALNPRIIPGYLSIKRPLVADKTDPFIDFSRLIEVIGRERATTIAVELEDYLINTQSWADQESDLPVAEHLAQHPDALDQLYIDLYPVLDCAKYVEWFKAAGYDGAIYSSTGATSGRTEYRVFDPAQVASGAPMPVTAGISESARMALREPRETQATFSGGVGQQFALEQAGLGIPGEFGYGAYSNSIAAEKPANFYAGELLTPATIKRLRSDDSIPAPLRRFFGSHARELATGTDPQRLLQGRIQSLQHRLSGIEVELQQAQGDDAQYAAAVALERQIKGDLGTLINHMPKLLQGIEHGASSERYLLWDQPLVSQPQPVIEALALCGIDGYWEVQTDAGALPFLNRVEALAHLARIEGEGGQATLAGGFSAEKPGMPRGKQVYRELEAMLGSPQQASRMLKGAGIEGVRYSPASAQRSGDLFVIFAEPAAEAECPQPIFHQQAGVDAPSFPLPMSALPASTISGDLADSAHLLAGVRRQVADSLEQRIEQLSGRQRWLLELPNVEANLVQLNKASLAQARSDLQQLNRWRQPSQSNCMPWNTPISDELCAKINPVLRLTPNEQLSGEAVFYLLAERTGSTQSATELLQKVGIIGAHSADGVALWDSASRSLSRQLEAKQDRDRFHLVAHGSKSLIDRFSMDKIGTGEGAQAFGYGLYFADNTLVAAHYQAARMREASWYGETLYDSPSEMISAASKQLQERGAGSALVAAAEECLHAAVWSPSRLERLVESHEQGTQQVLRGVLAGYRRLSNEQTTNFFVMPRGGMHALSAVEASDDRELSLGVTHIASGLRFVLDQDMSDEEASVRFAEHLRQQCDVAAAEEARLRVSHALANKPGDDFLESRLRDCDYMAHMARCAQKVQAMFGPFSVHRPVTPGIAYVVDLDIRNDEYIHYDKPFKHQSESTRDAIKELANDSRLSDEKRQALAAGIKNNAMGHDLLAAIAGRRIYTEVSSPADERLASMMLLEQGVQGVKYPDGHAREGISSGGYNYVVFNEDRIQILGHTTEQLRGEHAEIPLYDRSVQKASAGNRLAV